MIAFSTLAHHPRLVGEALVRLTQIRGERAEKALLTRLQEIEAELAGAVVAHYPPEDLERLRSLIAAGVLRGGSSAARRAVVQGALARLRSDGSGDRLIELRTVDLSGEPDLVDALLRALHELRRGSSWGWCCGATPRPSPRSCRPCPPPPRPWFAAACRSWPGASRASPSAWRRRRRSPPSTPPPLRARAAEAVPAAAPPRRMEGDLQLFGLPNLLQSLAQSALSGTLALKDAHGATLATLELRGGALAACSTPRLAGETAFYQLLERPLATAFLFAGRDSAAPPPATAAPAREILPLLMEGMRRYDEYERARALVPDATVLLPTGVRPTAPPGESDGAFVRELWGRLKNGGTAAACEEAVPADGYRIRTLLAHWLQEGAVAVSQFADSMEASR